MMFCMKPGLLDSAQGFHGHHSWAGMPTTKTKSSQGEAVSHTSVKMRSTHEQASHWPHAPPLLWIAKCACRRHFPILPDGQQPINRMPTTGPTYKSLITAAIVGLAERTGSSQPAIEKFIMANYPELSYKRFVREQKVSKYARITYTCDIRANTWKKNIFYCIFSLKKYIFVKNVE